MLCAAALPAQAATPAAGTLSPGNPSLSFASGPFMVPNDTGAATGTPTCQDPVAPCDKFALTVALPAGYMASHPSTIVRISTSWDASTGMGQEDYDIFLDDAGGAQVNASNGTVDPEVMQQVAKDGSNSYTILIVPATPLGSAVTTAVTLVTPAAGGGSGNGSLPPQAQPAGLPPRFKNDVAPPGVATTADEPSIGYNYNSRNGMYISSLVQYRLLFPWTQNDPISPPAKLPEACDAAWLDVTFPTEGVETLDPILHTDSKSGRTFVSQLTGANSLFAYTDDDGDNWQQGQIGPPNGGPDHQTIGTGPYPAGSPFAQIAAAAGFDYATYYCSQAVAGAFCARSDTGGLTFAQGSPAYIKLTDCGEPVGAIHGHVKVGADGAVYVPPKSCGALQGVAVSKDAGITWTSKVLPGTTADTEVDPSVAPSNPDAAGKYKLYDCFIDAEGHPHAQVSTNDGDTWANDYDLGRSVGVVNATFPEAVAGDPDRASCAFIGTSTPGNHDAADFAGIWYAYIATTYDGGKSWFTVNLSPNDPVQGAGGVCNAGTTCGSNRNLYDFNEITTDEKGRVLFGYADGCTGACAVDPVTANAFESKGVVGRQFGGRSLLAAFDGGEPAKPAPACLMGERSSKRSHLVWNAPDTGGDTIASYTISRSPALAGPYTQVGTTPAKTVYEDTTDNVTNPLYYRITATNSKGEGLASNIVKLPIGADPVIENSCAIPGVTVFTDPPGDSTGGVAQTDVLGLHVAELAASADKITLTMNIASLNPLVPAVYYIILSKDTAGNPIYLQADSTTNPGGLAFTYGSYAEGTAGVLTFTQVGTLDTKSTYNATTGQIFFVAARSIFGNPATGKAITADVRIRQGANAATSRDTGGPGSYTLNGTAICSGLLAPIADLAADVINGNAPLTVHFDGTGSSTKNSGATINSYTFDFGDGSPVVTQSSPKITHVYQSAGNYKAQLSVTDSVSQKSANTATKFITVAGANGTVPGAPVIGAAPDTNASRNGGGSTGRFGGALGLLGLLPLMMASLRRRRRAR